MANYYKELQRKADGKFCEDWSQARIEGAIAEITELMKGPLDNAARITLHQDRRALRERRAEMIGRQP